MTTGVATSPTTGTLTIRRREDGVLEVVGDPPDVHEFPENFLERELNRGVRITVAVTSDPPVVYDVTKTRRGDLIGRLRPRSVVLPVDTPLRVATPTTLWKRIRNRG